MPGPFNSPPNTTFGTVPKGATFECNHKLWRKSGVNSAVNCYSDTDIVSIAHDKPVYYVSATPTTVMQAEAILRAPTPPGFNPMSTSPEAPGAYEMAVKGGSAGGLFSRWDGYQWHATADNAPSALAINSRSEDAYDGTLVGWRELADKVSASSQPFGDIPEPRDDDPVHVLPTIETMEYTHTSMTEEIEFGYRFKANGGTICQLAVGTIQPGTPNPKAIQHYIERMREFKPVAESVLQCLIAKEIVS